MEFPNSKHSCFRDTRVSCQKSLFSDTLTKVLDALHPTLRKKLVINKSDLQVIFPNGSTIDFGGLDDHNRDNVLGMEWQTIWMNECNAFNYDDVEWLASRLNGSSTSNRTGNPIVRKMFFDCNPGSKNDWEYKVFVRGISPASNKVLADPELYGWVQINNEDEAYLRQFANASEKTLNRLVRGVWVDDNPNAMFKQKVIDAHRVPSFDDLPHLKRITVNLDPTTSKGKDSDLCGLTVTGIDAKGHSYVLADRSAKMTPQEWAKAAIDLFDLYQADCIVAEKNQGGLMVSETIFRQRPNAPVRLVHASRGKEARAEPVGILYDQGKVHHVGSLDELEDQMTSFDSPTFRGSPDRLDSLVWGLSELFQISNTSQPGRASVTYTSLF